jgi:dienelactone hydrolase
MLKQPIWSTPMRSLAVLSVLLIFASCARAEVKTKVIEYDFEGTKLKGYLAYDAAAAGKRPGVLVIHEWWGLDDYARKRARMLAELGYVAFCADMYGEGRTTEHPQEAGKFAGEVRNNLKTWQGRAQAALKTLRSQDQCDAKKVAAIGYCFGGATALQLAYTGADLAAVVTFHAALPVPTAEQAQAIKPRLLICHGGADAFIPEQSIKDLRAALDQAGVAYQFESYPGVVHSFTVPDVEKKGVQGLKYDAAADARSWRQMKEMFDRVFSK